MNTTRQFEGSGEEGLRNFEISKNARFFLLSPKTRAACRKPMQSKNDKLADWAFVAINALMGEINAARIMFLLARDEHYDQFVNPQADENLRNTCKVYMRRIAMASFASVAFKYRETYEKLLKPIGCSSKKAKELYHIFGKSPLEDWRGTCQHILDEKSKAPHSSKNVISTHKRVFDAFPDLFNGDSSAF